MYQIINVCIRFVAKIYLFPWLQLKRVLIGECFTIKNIFYCEKYIYKFFNYTNIECSKALCVCE